MMNYSTAEANARFWVLVLKLLKENFGPGDRMIETIERQGSCSAGI
jgi:hypothetical protein